jgi:hypothetical protein
MTDRDRLITFFYLLTRGIPNTPSMGWGDVHRIIDAIDTDRSHEYMHGAIVPGRQVAEFIVDRLLDEVGFDSPESADDKRRRETLRDAAKMLVALRDRYLADVMPSSVGWSWRLDINAMIDRCNLASMSGVEYSEPDPAETARAMMHDIERKTLTLETATGADLDFAGAIIKWERDAGETDADYRRDLVERATLLNELAEADATLGEIARLRRFVRGFEIAKVGGGWRAAWSNGTTIDAVGVVHGTWCDACYEAWVAALDIARNLSDEPASEHDASAPLYRWVPGMRAIHDEPIECKGGIFIREATFADYPGCVSLFVEADGGGTWCWPASKFRPDLDHGGTRGLLLDQVRELSGEPRVSTSIVLHNAERRVSWLVAGPYAFTVGLPAFAPDPAYKPPAVYGEGDTEGLAIMDALERLRPKSSDEPARLQGPGDASGVPDAAGRGWTLIDSEQAAARFAGKQVDVMAHGSASYPGIHGRFFIAAVGRYIHLDSTVDGHRLDWKSRGDVMLRIAGDAP